MLTPLIFNFIYKIIAHIVFPIVLLWRCIKGKEPQAKQRRGLSSIPRPEGPLIIFHGASVGESQVAYFLANALQANYPCNSLLTTVTEAAMQLLPDHGDTKHQTVFKQFAPMDHPVWVARFLDFWQPQLMVLVEGEYWPHLVNMCHERKIPVLIANGRISEKSCKAWHRFSKLTMAKMLSGCNAIYCISDADSQRLTSFATAQSPIKTITTGNIKWAMPTANHDKQSMNIIKNLIGNSPVWLAASTHQGEEEIILKAHRVLLKSFPNLITIIAPRHPIRCKQIIADHLANIPFETWTSMETNNITSKNSSFRTNILIIDKLGALGSFFASISLVFMGGSLFPKVGGHNIIEPAKHNCAILSGPHMDNWHAERKLFLANKALLSVSNETELYKQVKMLLSDKKKQKQLAVNAYNLCKSSQAEVHKITTTMIDSLSASHNQKAMKP